VVGSLEESSFIVSSLCPIGQVPASDPFGLWMRIVFTVDAIAMVFDAKDVIKYLAGDRQPVR